MSNSDRLQGGMKHAPGVMCIISGIPKWIGDSKDNGKPVELLQLKLPGTRWQCVCGATGVLTNPEFNPIWEVKGEGLTCYGRCSPNISFVPQKFLFPIGDSSLIEGEKWEEKLPKEDKIEQAQIAVMRFHRAFPATHKIWTDYQS